MKEYLNGLMAEYEELKSMPEEEVMKAYDENKAEMMRVYESEIDWYESKIYGYVG